MNYAKGIDISTYQDSELTPQRIDFRRPKELGIRFIINRVVFANRKDQDFDYNWAAEKEHGYLRTGYGFWSYWENSPTDTDQAKAFSNLMKNDRGEFPIVWMDVEKANDNYPPLPERNLSLPRIERYMKTVEDDLGIVCGLYTNFSGLTTLKPIPDWLQCKPLWIAWPLTIENETPESYIARTGIVPPTGEYWKNPWTLWQYSWKGPGLDAGMESHAVDMDYFNGTEEQLYSFCETEYVPPVEDQKQILEMKVIASALMVRSGPGTQYRVLDRLYSGDIVEVHDVAGINGAWVKIDEFENRWCCVQNSYGTYLRKVED